MVSSTPTSRVGVFAEAVRELGKTLAGEFVTVDSLAADEIVAAMKARLPPGPLRDSVRWEYATSGGRIAGQSGILIKAGGRTTTVRSKSGRSYDYARAEEFGTVNRPAAPFFWVTIRARTDQRMNRLRRVVQNARLK